MAPPKQNNLTKIASKRVFSIKLPSGIFLPPPAPMRSRLSSYFSDFLDSEQYAGVCGSDSIEELVFTLNSCSACR